MSEDQWPQAKSKSWGKHNNVNIIPQKNTYIENKRSLGKMTDWKFEKTGITKSSVKRKTIRREWDR